MRYPLELDTINEKSVERKFDSPENFEKFNIVSSSNASCFIVRKSESILPPSKTTDLNKLNNMEEKQVPLFDSPLNDELPDKIDEEKDDNSNGFVEDSNNFTLPQLIQDQNEGVLSSNDMMQVS